MRARGHLDWVWWGRGSHAHVAAVHHQDGAGDVGGGGGSQEHGGALDVFGQAGAAQGDPGNVVVPGHGMAGLGRGAGAHETRGHGVDPYPASGPFDGQGAGEHDQGRFGRVVGDVLVGVEGLEAGDAGGVDDASPALGGHGPEGGLGEGEGGDHVDLAGEAEALDRRLLGGPQPARPGVVDQDVQPAPGFSHRLHGLLSGACFGHVRRQGEGRPARLLHPGRASFGRLRILVQHRHPRSVLGERLGHGQTEAAPGAGDQRALARQVETVGNGTHGRILRP